MDAIINDREKVRDKILEGYPRKVAREREKHILVLDKTKEQKIEANSLTVPGVISMRGCAFAGTKGVVFGPIKDMVHIVHGPIGCAYYTWGTRRNKARTEPGGQNFMAYAFSTDMQERDIIFGGEQKLLQAIREAYRIFKPKAIGIYATCPVGLIGDDLYKVARQAEEELGVKVIPTHCEGYKGVSQSAGHHLASNTLMQYVIGTKDLKEPGPFDINIFGEYNIGGDAWEIKRLFEKVGYRIVTFFTGDSSYENIATAHEAKLSLLNCHRSINYTNRMMEEKWGVPWLKVNFFGVKAFSKALRDTAKFFDDPGLYEKTEQVIEEEMARVSPILERYRKRLEGKTAMLFVGGSRAHHFQTLFKDIGMKTVMAGYEFAHRDDYEGRKVIPDIKHSARSKALEDISFEKTGDCLWDTEFIAKKKEELPELMDYEGMMPHMENGSFVIDDTNHYEIEILIKELKPDIFCSGIKDKYVVQKLGVPSKQLHSYDYSGPYVGFNGAVNVHFGDWEKIPRL